MTNRRIDPEPITIFLAIVATLSATITAVNFQQTHYKKLPTNQRAEILSLLGNLEDENRYLRADLGIVRDIFSSAEFPNGNRVRLGSGAYLSIGNFRRYENISDNIFRRLRVLNKIGLKFERQAMKYSDLEFGRTSNHLGEAYRRLQQLLDARDLSVEETWARLESLVDLVERVIYEIRQQFKID